jgi:hypothetical protein
MWLNEGEIDECVRIFADHPIYGPAAQYLSEYRDIINSMSDGWCHWSSGTRPAGTLCTLLENARRARWNASEPDPGAERKALLAGVRRIKTFITKNKYMRQAGVVAPELQRAVPQRLPLSRD